MPLSMDCPEFGVIRIFSMECQFKVIHKHISKHISNFVFELVRKQ